MKPTKIILFTFILLVQSLMFIEKSYGVDCIDMMLSCWEANPYEPGSNAYIIFNDGCEAAGTACIQLQ